MEIIITEWGLNSYLEMKHNRVFTEGEYKNGLRPDVLLLARYPNDPKFNHSKFWSIATDLAKKKFQVDIK